jgi:hypothetical protein
MNWRHSFMALWLILVVAGLCFIVWRLNVHAGSPSECLSVGKGFADPLAVDDSLGWLSVVELGL